MKNLFRVIPIFFVVLGVLLLFERPAYAYADPGTGLLAIQAVGSALIAAGWYLRSKIRAFFRRGAKSGPEVDPEAGKNKEPIRP